MIEACIFDIGGVLIRTEDAIASAIKDTTEKCGLPVPPRSEITKHFGVSHRSIVMESVASVYTGKDFKRVAEKCYEYFKQLYPEKTINKFELMPGVEQCLSELNKSGVKTACQTGMTSDEANTLFNHFNLAKYFPVVVTVDDVKKPRPDPEAMYLILKKLNITDKSKCLYIGDTVKDIQFARNAGVKIACVTTGPQGAILAREKPDYCIDNLTELLELV